MPYIEVEAISVNDREVEIYKKPQISEIVEAKERGSFASVTSDIYPVTKVIDGDFIKIFSWYDNEWGYSNRLVEAVMAF